MNILVDVNLRVDLGPEDQSKDLVDMRQGVVVFLCHGVYSVRTGAPGAPNFAGPSAKSPPCPAPRGGAGHLSDRAGQGGASFLAPQLILRSGAPLFTGPRPVHRLYFVTYLPIAAFFLRI